MKRRFPPTRIFRYTLLSVILGSILALAFGIGARSFEEFCPFGGVESLWGLYQTREFSCTLGPLNLAMLIAVLILAVVAKKAFCGWACPIGFLSEISARFTGVFGRAKPRQTGAVTRLLMLLRYVSLAAALYFTYRTGELVLRGYDPFFLIFSGFGHGSAGIVSWFVLGAILIGLFLMPMFFCRFLCPLGAVFDPFSRIGILKITRNPSKCTECNLCQAKCPQNLTPQKTIKLRHRDCTLCLECVEACPVKGALDLKATL